MTENERFWLVFVKNGSINSGTVLGSGPSRTDPSHPDIAFAGRVVPTIKGTVQEDDYRTEVRFKDKNLFKN